MSGLSGEATAAHFHGPAEPGKNAGVLVPAPGVKTGAFEGSATLTDDQAKALMAGQTYFLLQEYEPILIGALNFIAQQHESLVSFDISG